jgi:hypothetical protein
MASHLPDNQPIYRAMVEEDGSPKLGSTATTLGIRQGKDIDVDSQGNVHIPDFTSRGKNGMSCSPSPEQLPPFALPIQWGGSHRKTEVWRIDAKDLGPDLIAQQDGPSHISIGPSRSMTIEEYEQAIQSTAGAWQKIV